MPADDPITREECAEKEKDFRNGLNRIHTRVDGVEKTATSIETSARIMSECVCKMEKVMFGDQNADGIVTKVSNLKQKVDGVYWLSGVAIIAFVGALVGMIFNK